MDIVFKSSKNGSTAIINGDELKECRRYDDPINGDVFKLLYEYTESNWITSRDATHFHDKDVPEAPVKIKTISIQDNSLVVTGFGLYGI